MPSYSALDAKRELLRQSSRQAQGEHPPLTTSRPLRAAFGGGLTASLDLARARRSLACIGTKGSSGSKSPHDLC